MRSRTILKSLSVLRNPLAGILVLTGVGAAWYVPTASAKDIPMTAIELYDGPSGAAYVQLSNVLINGKAEMRDCSLFQSAAVDKSTYGRMSKVILAVGGVLERNAEGVMHYSTGSGQPICVVPSNAKFEHGGLFRSPRWPIKPSCREARSAAGVGLLCSRRLSRKG